MNYEEMINYIYSIPRFTTKNELSHTKEFIKELLPNGSKGKIIHVAGTNGKGSVCAFLSGILREGKKKTGLFTSPHLVKINERFQIDGEEIKDKELIEIFLQVKAVIEKLGTKGFPHPTFFELLFLMALVYFQEKDVEYIILETGLGGRLDATNAISNPILSVITSISLDHTEFLGDTIEKIAMEKAGIIKSQVPVVYDSYKEQASQVIERRCKEVGTRGIPVGKEQISHICNRQKEIDFSLHSRYYGTIQLHLKTIAIYQTKNAALAVEAAGTLGDSDLSKDVVCRGIGKTQWQGRMEEVEQGVFLDGAHNPDGVMAWVETVRSYSKDQRKLLLFTAVKEKNYQEMIQEICETICFDEIVVTQVHGDREVPARELGEIFRKYTDAYILVEPDIKKAYETAKREKKEGILFCAGSLYLIGELKDIIRRNKRD